MNKLITGKMILTISVIFCILVSFLMTGDKTLSLLLALTQVLMLAATIVDRAIWKKISNKRKCN